MKKKLLLLFLLISALLLTVTGCSSDGLKLTREERAALKQEAETYLDDLTRFKESQMAHAAGTSEAGSESDSAAADIDSADGEYADSTDPTGAANGTGASDTAEDSNSASDVTGDASADASPHHASAPSLDLRFGSALTPEGTNVVISIFASDETYRWDFENETDVATRAQTLEALSVACEWLEETLATYDCEATYVYDWSEDSSLLYEATFEDVDLTSADAYVTANNYIWVYIDNRVETLESLAERYEADNVIYILYYNTPASFEQSSNTRNYYEGMSFPYEFVNIYAQAYGIYECPAAYAHEILHTYGAPDLYAAYEDNYDISEEYVAYCAQVHANEIMYNVYDVDTGEPRYDKVSNIMEDVTAYYIGIAEAPEEVEAWGLAESQHEEADTSWNIKVAVKTADDAADGD